ncbi:hypothetical protein LTR35_004618 [Friedmanniomyces endolithicus]|uniref:Fe2OG dioxygenase domain-containing protein n=1 Tax=Friedmanniomyces endolithicus TaxID=329885 RepID=A0AAN6JAV8_9PEZI|nr:hypothetical protein LTR35_004618 [Friedmanniomyces endolithicus]KAK0299085.1 hypothetical protein LTS00_002195 [Friedmanniomyces endolithicus]KAK0322816.1 hypothetical protein LTR82_006273 [Friedmanniomyces endolithicus]
MAKRPRTLDAFFAPPPAKKQHIDPTPSENGNTTTRPPTAPPHTDEQPQSTHPTYPFPIPHLPASLTSPLHSAPATPPQVLNNHPDLDILYYKPYIPARTATALFHHLRRSLPFYRVEYTIKRGTIETEVNTPRFTTVFGLDSSAVFPPHDGKPLDAKTRNPLAPGSYRCRPRPIPQCLSHLLAHTERTTDSKFNFALVNYYASGSDSIAFHSDSESFLGPDPTIASFTLGSSRDFLLKHKPTPSNHSSETKAMKLPLASGDMLLMKGQTQRHWLHSIPKRKGPGGDGGRINITFRRALSKAGTENYYRYNVGDAGGDGGQVYKWDDARGTMRPWKPSGGPGVESSSRPDGVEHA